MGRVAKFMLSVLFASLCLSAAELRFEPEPCLLGTFQVVVTGVPEQRGEVVLFNLATKEHVVLELKKEGDALKSPILQALRPCDQLTAEGAKPVIVSGVGDHVVAATSLGCGLSAVAKVGPRSGTAQILLEVREGEEWKPASGLGAGDYRLRVLYPPADRTCERDPLPGGLTIRAAKEEQCLELREDAETSGSFTWHFSGAFELDKEMQRLLFVLRWGERCLRVPAVCTSVSFHAVDKELSVPIQLLPLKVEPDVALFVPVGCRATLKLSQPEKPDEVLWWVAGQWFSGPQLELTVDERVVAKVVPHYPEALVMKVFARKGASWGTTTAAVSVVPHPELLFVDPETNAEIRAWPKDKAFKLKLRKVFGFPDEISVLVGKLGPHPKETTVTLFRVRDGVYESKPLDPQDWEVQAGEYLWAQLCYPEPIACVIAVLLRVQ